MRRPDTDLEAGSRAWSAASGSFAGLTASGQTGVIAALAVLSLAGGQASIRRVSV